MAGAVTGWDRLTPGEFLGVGDPDLWGDDLLGSTGGG